MAVSPENQLGRRRVYTGETDGRLPRGHRQTLAEINRPFFTARRNAAFERVADIFRSELLPSAKGSRVELYRRCMILLEEAMVATRRSQVKEDSLILHFLSMLKETIGTCFAIVEHDMKLAEESTELLRHLGKEQVGNLHTPDDAFSESEMSIMDCVEELLRACAPVLESDTNAMRAGFNSEDSRRYQQAWGEYQAYYRADGGG